MPAVRRSTHRATAADQAPLREFLQCAKQIPTLIVQLRICSKGLTAARFAKEAGMSEFKRYRRKQIAELRPYVPGEPLDGISISQADRTAGSPKAGDMIARNPKNHADQWLVSGAYFADNFEAA